MKGEAMSETYTVTIVKRVSEVKTVQGAWGVIGTRPYTQEEANKAMISQNWDRAIKEIYGYLPSREEEVKDEDKVFEQTVRELSIAGVIRAINGL